MKVTIIGVNKEKRHENRPIESDKTLLLSYIAKSSLWRLSGMDRDGPERTKTDRNRPKWTLVDTETESLGTKS